MNDTAPISCIITSYNNRATLSAAITSILSQSLSVAEIIVADDASTDGSRELILEFSKKFPQIRPIFQPKNVGVAENRDMGYRSARFDFVTQLDGDDVFAADKIKAEWNALASSKGAVAYSLIARVWPGQPWRSRVIDPRETVDASPEIVLERLLARTGAIPRDMLFSKELYIRTGGYSQKTMLYEDWQLKIRLAIEQVEWRFSGTLGTIYIQRAKSLSNVDREKHLYWKRYVINEEYTKIKRPRNAEETSVRPPCGAKQYHSQCDLYSLLENCESRALTSRIENYFLSIIFSLFHTIRFIKLLRTACK